jgi:hypothetical protein
MIKSTLLALCLVFVLAVASAIPSGKFHYPNPSPSALIVLFALRERDEKDGCHRVRRRRQFMASLIFSSTLRLRIESCK